MPLSQPIIGFLEVFELQMPAELVAVVKSLRGCEKWILHKILHRFSGPKKFPTFFFRRKKNQLSKKYFLKNIFFPSRILKIFI